MSSRLLTSLLLPGLLVLSLVGNAQKSAPTSMMLKPGKAVTQSLQSGQSYDYQVSLKAGEALKATVEQKGVDVVVTAYAPDGTKLAAFDSPTSTEYKEFVTIVAPTAGRYRLAVTPFEPKAAPGTFVMMVDRILTPAQYTQSQADDRKRADAVAAYLQTPHPDKTSEEQRMEMLKINPEAMMLKDKNPEIEAAKWLTGNWTATGKRFATATSAELNFPARTAVLRFDPKTPNMLEMDAEANGKFQPLMAFEPLSRQWIQAYMDAGDTGTAWALLKGRDWQDNKLMLEGESGRLGICSARRQTWTKTDDRTVRVLNEERKADGSWMPVGETMYTKTGASDITSK